MIQKIWTSEQIDKRCVDIILNDLTGKGVEAYFPVAIGSGGVELSYRLSDRYFNEVNREFNGLVPSVSINFNLSRKNDKPNIQEKEGFDYGWIENKNVLLLLGIVHSGKTLRSAIAKIKKFKLRSITTVATVWKSYNSNIKEPLHLFELNADRFLFGFGMDYNGDFIKEPNIYYLD
jgi:hypoxanthine phosphoribosyltransferase